MSFKLLAPFVPSTAEPFGRREAAHLLRRAGFGASREEINKAVEQGIEAAVEGLFDEATDEEEAFQTTFAAINGRLMNFEEPEAGQAWWVYRMLQTRVPLREKLTLFWHGHFATNYGKVDNMTLMHRQIETIRRHAWGNVRDLTLALAKDPAMLVWLDGESSTKEHPNENFARELMELFTLGIGHYTEADVKAAARALTGWTFEGGELRESPAEHDNGEKTILGKTGRWSGSQLVAMLADHPATAHRLASRLCGLFMGEQTVDAPAVAALAVGMRDHHLDIGWGVETILRSRAFFASANIRTRVLGPAEFVIGACRTLLPLAPPPSTLALAGWIRHLGQDLFNPPTSAGGPRAANG